MATDLSHDLKYEQLVSLDTKLVDVLKTMNPDNFRTTSLKAD